MSAPPTVDFDDLATKRDLEGLANRRDLDKLEKRFDALETRLAGIDSRIDRLFYLMVIAVLGMLGAVTTLVVRL